MQAADFVTDILIASSEEAARFTGFLRNFLTANGFPFVIIHNSPETDGEHRRIVFEDEGVCAKFAREWGLGGPGVAQA